MKITIQEKIKRMTIIYFYAINPNKRECLSFGDSLWSLYYDKPNEARIAYILKHKPKDEQTTRLNNFRPVVSKLPIKVIKAGEALGKARKAYNKALEAYVEATEAYNKARKAYDKAWDAYMEAILANTTKLQALHTKDVPHHTWNGTDIF